MTFTLSEIRGACKSNGVNPEPILQSLRNSKKPKEVRSFWESFYKVWEEFWQAHKKEPYIWLKTDWKELGDIYDLLKKKAENKGFVWDCDIGCNGFKMYLQRAYEHSDFINKDFRFINLLRQFNNISNEQTFKSGNRIGTKGSAVNMQSAYNKLNSFAD